MNETKILDRVTELFSRKLQRKTGWGRNEVLAVYKESMTQALKETLAKILNV